MFTKKRNIRCICSIFFWLKQTPSKSKVFAPKSFVWSPTVSPSWNGNDKSTLRTWSSQQPNSSYFCDKKYPRRIQSRSLYQYLQHLNAMESLSLVKHLRGNSCRPFSFQFQAREFNPKNDHFNPHRCPFLRKRWPTGLLWELHQILQNGIDLAHCWHHLPSAIIQHGTWLDHRPFVFSHHDFIET